MNMILTDSLSGHNTIRLLLLQYRVFVLAMVEAHESEVVAL